MAARASTGFDFHAFVNADVPTRVARLRRLAWLLDAALRLPGTRMRVGLNGLIGAPPAIGDLFDVAYKANLRNLAIVEAYFGLTPRR